MDYCLLQDVFPDWKKRIDGPTEDSISVGCTDGKAAAKARKEQKKRAKKCKDPSLRYLEPDYPLEMPDPDRPSFRKQQEVPALSSKTGMVESRPFGESLVEKEGFEVPPKVPGPAEQYTVKRPKYFGASEDDDVEEFAPFTNIIGDDPAYRLDSAPKSQNSASIEEVSDFLMKFQPADKDRSTTPNLEDAWKPITPPGTPTAFFEYLATPAQAKWESPLQKRSASPALGSDISKKLDEIFSRLDQLEQNRRQSSQTEILLFVGSGVLLLGSLELLCRSRSR